MRNAMIDYQSERIAHSLFILGITLMTVGVLIGLFMTMQTPALALPEYAARTGDACATCHVSPGGAGPLTLQGLSWIAEGRPNKVTAFEDVLLAPGVQDAAVLYEVGCAPCHGFQGEGLSASRLVGYDFNEPYLERIIIEGYPDFKMPGFDGQFTDAQLEGLAEYVQDLSAGRIEPMTSYPLPKGEILCVTGTGKLRCGRN